MSYGTGNVVLYHNSYYIVKSDDERRTTSGELKRFVELMPLNYSNATIHLNESDPIRNINSIKLIASNVVDFIQNQMVRFIDDLSEHEEDVE